MGVVVVEVVVEVDTVDQFNSRLDKFWMYEEVEYDGTVIGPSTFLTFVNDLPELIQSSMYMFADDTKIYRGIEGNNDCLLLQSDIDRSVSWSSTWHLLFNPDKCKVMTIGRSVYIKLYYDSS